MKQPAAPALSRQPKSPSPDLMDLFAVLETSYRRIEAERDRNCWIYVRPMDDALAACRDLFERANNGEHFPLLGVPFGVKDNIDVAGMPTTAACPSFSHIPGQSAVSVERLVAAGAICLGKTNLDQFATGLSGNRSPYGACGSVADTRYVSGGSSSGSAVVVAAGHVAFSLGTDTGGSGRIPAGFNGIVGVKPTIGLASSRGLVPNCPTLDCVSIFSNTVDDGRQVLNIIKGYDPADPYSRVRPAQPPHVASPFAFGRLRPEDIETFGMPECAELYEQACTRLSALGGCPVAVDFAPFVEAGRMLFSGPWIAERVSAIRNLIDIDQGDLLDVTRSVLRSAAQFSAADAFAAQHRLLRLRREVSTAFEQFEMLVVPTAPRPYTIAEMNADPVTLNTHLGYYSYFANLLDLCGVAIPNGTLSNGMAMGITLLAPAWADDTLLAQAQRLCSGGNGVPFGLRAYSEAAR
ncbi:MAG: allophanate hydrolase [Pseudorhodoplanes sp.]